jgi:hypothetical protein
MASWPISDERLREMYVGGRAGTTARRYSRVWASVFGMGLAPRRWVTLEVAGRRSGRIARYPLGMADWRDGWYLVPMLGEQSGWVKNVRAAGGRVSIRQGRAASCQLFEVPVEERPAIIRRYLEKVPGGRPHIPVDRCAELVDFVAIAPDYPVFQVMRAVRREPAAVARGEPNVPARSRKPAADRAACDNSPRAY